MYKPFRLAFVVLVVFSSAFVHADQLILKNGDRLSGTIVRGSGDSVVITTDYAGEVTVKWDAVQQMSSTQPLHVSRNGGESVVGVLSATPEVITVETKDQGAVQVPKADLKKIRNDKEQLAYDRYVHPGLFQSWTVGSNISFALTRGNSETKNLALSFTADRKTLHDHLGLYSNSVYATNDAAGAVPAVTANAVQGGARYDRDFTKRLFSFVGADFQTDDLQSLNLRQVYSGGLGVHLIKTDNTTFDLLTGLNYTKEDYEDLSRNLAAGNFGEEFMHKFGSTVLIEKLYAFPDFNNAGEYRAAFNFGTVTKLNRFLGWQNSFSNIYVTNPPEGKRKNDILLTTGLNITLGTK